MEIWLLETKYKDGVEYEEIFFHISNTDIWITDTGYFSEHLENVRFTDLFWDKTNIPDGNYLLTKIGVLS